MANGRLKELYNLQKQIQEKREEVERLTVMFNGKFKELLANRYDINDDSQKWSLVELLLKENQKKDLITP